MSIEICLLQIHTREGDTVVGGDMFKFVLLLVSGPLLRPLCGIAAIVARGIRFFPVVDFSTSELDDKSSSDEYRVAYDVSRFNFDFSLSI